MIAKVESACLIGMEAAKVYVEVSLAKGMPTFSIVGLPDASVREAKDRVVAAIRNTGFEFPERRVTVNLAPAELRKEGPSFDLAIALGILLASEAITPRRWPRCLWLGELALDGAIRPIRGALPLVRRLWDRDKSPIVLPAANLPEVSFLKGVRVLPFSQLRDVISWLNEESEPPKAAMVSPWVCAPLADAVDLADIKGQAMAKRVLEIAAAGHHNLLMVGCPGTGKTLLARAFPSLLSTWSLDEALDATQVHSVAGALGESGLLKSRPFRNPHHSVSPAALIGGGDVPVPGEISLAHRGVLFLDELPEFRRDSLEALRTPLEEGRVHIQRARGRAVYPSEFLMLAAMNPCPCGFRGHPKKECLCTPLKIQKYLAKVSGPLVDRIDLHIELPVLKVEELFCENAVPESSQSARQRVEKALTHQRRRFSYKEPFRAFNAHMQARELKRFCELSPEAKTILQTAVERLGLSARAYDRIRKVARTIADLDNDPAIHARHVAEAVQYRALDRPVKSMY